MANMNGQQEAYNLALQQQAQFDEVRHGYYGGLQSQALNQSILGMLGEIYGALGNPSNEQKPKSTPKTATSILKEVYSDSLTRLGMKTNPALKLVPKEGDGVMGYMKDYFVKHRELLMGLTIVVLLDHFIFGGAFRTKIEAIVNGILNNAQKKLTDETAVVPAKAA